jgi:Asp-tRNA(Asn)/Glu-tRNA(Gln) amidotransferase A subunit family amidase
MDTFPDNDVVADLTAAQTVVMAYEAARAIEIPSGAEVSTQLTTLLTTGAAIPEEEYQAARDIIAGAELPPYDAILTPGALGPAPAGLAATGDPVMSRPWQALGLPAVAVPGHRDEAGLPLGLQLVGHTNEETALLATACWVERVLVP